MTAHSARILFMCLILDLLSRRYALDEISISAGDYKGPMTVGQQRELQCAVQTVAKSVIVRWYSRQHLVNQTIFTDHFNTSDRNRSTHLIHPNTSDDGAQYWCEAELELGGPQPPLKVTSERLNFTVHFKPIINETKLPFKVPVFRGYEMVLICEAEGNPKPTISWNLSTNDLVYSETLTVTDSTPKDVYCIASNSIGSTTRHVQVVLKEDYLPLIAGLVAITVAFISVIFIFIYSIYYKTAKMGRYSLKDAKPSAHNGNIAQNGKENTIPMKKLSQSNILA